MMHMLSTNDWCSTLAVGSVMYDPLIFKAGLLGFQVPPRALVVAVIELAMLHSTQVVRVLFRQDLAVLHWLNSAVVVILVYLLVDSGVHVLMLMRLDSFMLHRRRYNLVYCGIVVTRA